MTFAREYQSVIVSNVPVFDSQLENEARRFIALVDELYDRNVNLIVSAAAEPTGCRNEINAMIAGHMGATMPAAMTAGAGVCGSSQANCRMLSATPPARATTQTN